MRGLTSGLFVSVVFSAGLAQISFADVIASPASDIALQSNGGVAFSSLGNGSWDGSHGPDKLNDGNEDGNFYSSPISLYHSAMGANAGGTFGVVLNHSYDINEVDLYTRTDCCGTRIDNSGTDPYTLTILLAGVPVYSTNFVFISAGNNITKSGPNDTALGRIMAIPNVLGDTVQITQSNPDYLNIAELEAFQAPEPASLSLLVIAGVGLIAHRRRV